jgi:hypothetical protein
VPSARAGEFLYTRDASSSPIVATAARFFSEDGGHKVDKAFTRGDWSLSNNFKLLLTGRSATTSVENLTFGPAKTFIERCEADQWLLKRFVSLSLTSGCSSGWSA